MGDIKKPTNEYILGYTKISDIDNEIMNNKSNTWTADWENDNNKNDANYNTVRNQIMPTKNEESFKYSIETGNVDFIYDDPTFLGYDIIFINDSSPLFNYGIENESPRMNSAISFIKKYSRIDEIAKREDIYKEFIIQINKLFNFSFNPVKNTHNYYIESIAGLDKLANKINKYGEDLIIISLTEDISMKSIYLAELYNNLIYSYKNQRYLIPENCLRFDMIIKITDIRTFKIPNPNYNENDSNSSREIINDKPSYIAYKLHDCNFNFFNSQSHGSDMELAGFGGGKSTTPAKLMFSIKYKSVSKEINTNLIKNSLHIYNKRTDIIDSKIINNEVLFQNSYSSKKIDDDKKLNDNKYKKIKSGASIYDNKEENGNKSKFSKALLNQKNSIMKEYSKSLQSLGDTILDNAVNSLENYANNIINRFDQIRGDLLQDILRHVRTKINVPEIYPDNIYDDDFNSLSLNNFYRGLASNTSNSVQDFLENLPGLPKI
jgi:hypothetical protein